MADRDGRDWSGRSRGGNFGYRFFIFIIRNLGLGVAYAFLAFVVPYFILFAPRATSAVWGYNRRILRYGRLRSCGKLYLHYYRFGQTLIDKIALAGGMQDKFSFSFDNYSEFIDLLDSGTGLVMISAHVGNWAAGATFFGDYGGRMNIVMYDAEYQKIKEALEKNSVGRNFKVIPIGGDTLESVLKIKKALDDREYVCFMGDRFMPGTDTRVRNFMGHEADFPAGPFVTASRMGVPVVFYYALREPGRRYVFRFTLAEAGGRGGEDALLDRFVESTEKIVREYPQQWFNFYRFWK